MSWIAAFATLGCTAEADRVMQDAWLRLGGPMRARSAIWVTTEAGRLALEALGSAPPGGSNTKSGCGYGAGSCGQMIGQPTRPATPVASAAYRRG